MALPTPPQGTHRSYFSYAPEPGSGTALCSVNTLQLLLMLPSSQQLALLLLSTTHPLKYVSTPSSTWTSVLTNPPSSLASQTVRIVINDNINYLLKFCHLLGIVMRVHVITLFLTPPQRWILHLTYKEKTEGAVTWQGTQLPSGQSRVPTRTSRGAKL